MTIMPGLGDNDGGIVADLETRTDPASDEEFGVQMMISQPFQF